MRIVFWITVSALIAGALLLLLPPLVRRGARGSGITRNGINVAVYRDQLRELKQDLAVGVLSREGYEEAKRELERRMLDDVGDTGSAQAKARYSGRNAAVAIGAALPVVAVALYVIVGNPQALLAPPAASTTQVPRDANQARIQEMVARLEARMEQDPEDVEGWIMLGRSYTAMGRFVEATHAYANAVARRGSDAALLADYAGVLGQAQGRRLQGDPETIAQRALIIDPRNVKALGLVGAAAFQRGDYAGAVEYWERILQQVPGDSKIAQSVRDSVAQAKARALQSGTSIEPR